MRRTQVSVIHYYVCAMAVAKRAKVLASSLDKQLTINFGQFLSLPLEGEDSETHSDVRLAICSWLLLNLIYSLRKEVVSWDGDSYSVLI